MCRENGEVFVKGIVYLVLIFEVLCEKKNKLKIIGSKLCVVINKLNELVVDLLLDIDLEDCVELLVFLKVVFVRLDCEDC